MWITLYWITFLLTWYNIYSIFFYRIFLPITLDYESAGEFTFK